jgi:outer membrane protein assembly factor BamB
VILSVADQLRAFDALSGAPRWAVELEPKCTIGRIIATADRAVACWSRPRKNVSDGAIAVDPNGTIAWQVELGAHERSLAATPDRVFVAGAHWPTGVCNMFQVLLPHTGLLVSQQLAWGFDAVEPWRDALLARDREGCAAHPGLFSLHYDGTLGRAILHEPVYDVHVGDALVTVVTAGPNKLCRVSIRDAATLDERWATLASDFYVAVAGDLLVHIAEDNRHVVVGRDSATGNIRWQSAPTDMRVGTITLADGYVFVRTIDGITILDPATGMPVAPLGPGAQVAEHAGRIYIADEDLQCFAPP